MDAVQMGIILAIESTESEPLISRINTNKGGNSFQIYKNYPNVISGNLFLIRYRLNRYNNIFRIFLLILTRYIYLTKIIMKQLSYIILGFIIGGLLTYYFCPRIEQLPVKHIKPKSVITIEQAKVLSDNWTIHRKPAVDSAAKKQGRQQDDRSTYWTLDDIENYLGYAKNYSDSLGYTMTGIRVYLGEYGENAGQTKKNLTTMFIVPTGEKAKSQASSLNLFLPPTDNNIPVPPLNKGDGGNAGYPQ